jgi:taurine dioxygenase
MAQAEQASTADLYLEHLSPKIGSVIRGIDLREPLSPEQTEYVRQALLDRKVVFFRDQDITTEQHLDFGRNFGELEVHPFAPHKENYPEVLAIKHDKDRPGRENGWHSDVTWREKPSLGSVLRLLEVPDVGGDTLFADMEAAYVDLPDAIKEKVEGKVAVHDFVLFRERMKKAGATPEKIEEMNKKYPKVEHPVIRTHPETGRKSIYVNIGFTQYIKDMDKAESDALLPILYATAATPEYQCRFRWEKNSMAFWDNRACQHYAASDYWPHRRVAERVTIIGDRPA